MLEIILWRMKELMTKLFSAELLTYDFDDIHHVLFLLIQRKFCNATSSLSIGSYYYVISGGGIAERGKVMVW